MARLSRLMYCSELTGLGPGDPEDQGPAGVLQILHRAQSRNREVGVTGVLLFDQNYFVQILEGDRQAVTALFCRVATDPRHTNVELISVADADSRDFPDWSMAYLAPSAGRRIDYQTHLGTPRFDPTAADAAAIRALLTATHRQHLAA